MVASNRAATSPSQPYVPIHERNSTGKLGVGVSLEKICSRWKGMVWALWPGDDGSEGTTRGLTGGVCLA
jgi:hypothetical protein